MAQKTPKKASSKTSSTKKTSQPSASSSTKKTNKVASTNKGIAQATAKKAVATAVEKATHGALYVRGGRHFFTEDRSLIDMPELLAAQISSYQWFLDYGIQEALE